MASPLSYNLELSSLEAAHGLRRWLPNADGAEAVLLAAPMQNCVLPIPRHLALHPRMVTP